MGRVHLYATCNIITCHMAKFSEHTYGITQQLQYTQKPRVFAAILVQLLPFLDGCTKNKMPMGLDAVLDILPDKNQHTCSCIDVTV